MSRLLRHTADIDWRRVSCLIAALALPTATVRAQRPPTPDISERVRMTVYDSVAHAPLANAAVFVSGDDTTPLVRGRTDAAGCVDFRLAPGRWLVRVSHDRYDSLGVTLPAQWIDVRRSARQNASLALPSRRTLTRAFCGTALSERRGVVTGVVADARTQRVLPGATVVAQWSDLLLSAGRLDVDAQRATATADNAGRYVVCGVPSGDRLTFWAKTDSTTTGAVWFDVSPDGFARLDFGIDGHAVWPDGTAASDAAVYDPRSDALPPPRALGDGVRYRVMVLDAAGRAVPSARAILAGRAARTAGRDGLIAFDSLSAGTQMLDVRALGYLPLSRGVDVPDGQLAPDTLHLLALKAVLDTVHVVVQSLFRGIDNGFDDRRRHAFGTFITSEQIARRRPVTFSDLLHGVMGVQLQLLDALPPARVMDGQGLGWPKSHGAGVAPTMRGSWRGDRCVPAYVVDGIRIPGEAAEDIDVIAPVTWIRSVEVYARSTDVPPSFIAAAGNCGVVVIWLKR